MRCTTCACTCSADGCGDCFGPCCAGHAARPVAVVAAAAGAGAAVAAAAGAVVCCAARATPRATIHGPGRRFARYVPTGTTPSTRLLSRSSGTASSSSPSHVTPSCSSRAYRSS
jgi:hypothetical protein